jgi:hypothetical protein
LSRYLNHPLVILSDPVQTDLNSAWAASKGASEQLRCGSLVDRYESDDPFSVDYRIRAIRVYQQPISEAQKEDDVFGAGRPSHG